MSKTWSGIRESLCHDQCRVIKAVYYVKTNKKIRVNYRFSLVPFLEKLQESVFSQKVKAAVSKVILISVKNMEVENIVDCNSTFHHANH